MAYVRPRRRKARRQVIEVRIGSWRTSGSKIRMTLASDSLDLGIHGTGTTKATRIITRISFLIGTLRNRRMIGNGLRKAGVLGVLGVEKKIWCGGRRC